MKPFSLIMLLAMPVSAAPTYLICDIENEPEHRFALDEVKHSAAISLPDMPAHDHPAAFTASSVSIEEGGPNVRSIYVISRVDLTIVHKVTMLGAPQPDDHGKCAIERPPAKRAF